MITALFKVFSQQLRGILTIHLKDALQLKILRTSINLRDDSFLSKYQEKSMNVPGKLSVTQKPNSVFQRMFRQGISLIIILFFFSQTNVIFKSNLVLIA